MHATYSSSLVYLGTWHTSIQVMDELVPGLTADALAQAFKTVDLDDSGTIE